MSAVADDVAPGPILPTWLRRYPLAPAEGWLSVALVAIMALTPALSLDDAAWVLGDRDFGDFFAWAAILGTLVGVATAKAGWPRWPSHFVGAVFAALIVPVFVGGVLLPDGGSPAELYQATAASTVRAWTDLFVLDRAVTRETGHYLLVLGLVSWSLGQFAGFAVFGHRRPLDAVLVVGIVLLANMAITPHDQLGYLVIYTVAGLALLARSHAFEEQTAWLRRRIGDASAVRGLYLRGGAAFIAAAVFGSLVLTASASSAPLAGAWSGFGDWVIETSQWLQRYLPFGGDSRQLGVGFGRNAVISGSWNTDDRVAITVQLEPGDIEPYYWRAVTYDRFELNAWSWTDGLELGRPAGAALFAGLAEDPAALGARRQLAFTVEPQGMRTQAAISPQDPVTIDRDSKVVVVGQTGWFSSLLAGGGGPYNVTALVPVNQDVPGGRTENRLRAAGQNYPEEIRRLYLVRPQGALGPEALKLLDRIKATAPSQNPYDIARHTETELKKFRYEADVRHLPCEQLSVVECFARYKQGYCEYYASTMVMLLREAGIPARLAEGFLPSTRNRVTGIERISGSSAHAWAEVYFPGYGWVTFDPTGGPVGQSVPLPSGRPVPSASAPATLPVPSGRDDDPEGPSQLPAPGGGTGTGGGQVPPGLMIAVAVLLLVAFGALGAVAWVRGPRGEVTPDSAWRGISRLAARLGFGPRPTQTVYEYAGALGDLIPSSRPELQTVARAKVEVAYGRRFLGDDRLRSLRAAHRRLRLGLLRLAVRRKERRERRRRRGL